MYHFKYAKVIAIITQNCEIAKVTMVPQLQLRVGSWQKRHKIYLTWMIQHRVCHTMIDSRPWHFKKFSTPSTSKVLCPWHHKSSVPLAPQNLHTCSPCEQSSLHRFFMPTRVVSEVTSLLRCPVLLGMGLVLPLLPWEVLFCLMFPLGIEWIAVPQITRSHNGIWAQSSSNT